MYLLYLIQRVLLTIKASAKLRLFHKYCIMDDSVTISADANCSKDSTAKIVIANNCDICCNLIAKGEAIIDIGHHTTVRGSTIIGAYKSIVIGNYVIISNNVRIYDNNNHPTSPQKRMQMCATGDFYSDDWNWSHSDCKPIIIEDNVWIGERSTILKGVKIGKGSIIASNTVVTRDVPPFSVVAGNPGKVVKVLENDLED